MLSSLGRYRLVAKLGEGGMGEVFAAEVDGAEGFQRRVAVKRLRPELAKSSELASRLVDEAKLAKRLTHGNIVQIIDVDIDGDQPFLVTELVDGLSLGELAGEFPDRVPPLAISLFVVDAVAAALGHAHDLHGPDGEPTPIVHRDVKPANILISKDGVVKLADFGIGKSLAMPTETAPGMIKGTVGYLSPEQARGGEIDSRSDQFSLGVVLFELLTGSNPFAEAPSLLAYVELLANPTPTLADADVDPKLAGIASRAMARDPADRFDSIGDFAEALTRWRVSADIAASQTPVRDAVRSVGRGPTTPVADIRRGLAHELDVASAPTQAIATEAPASSRAWVALAAIALVAIGALVFWRISVSPLKLSVVPAAPVAVDAAAPAIDAAVAAPVDAAIAEPVDAAPTPPVAVARGRGTLRINVLPWAAVFVDGKRRGETPLTLTLPAGRHRVELVNPTRRARLSVDIAAGKTRRISSWPLER